MDGRTQTGLSSAHIVSSGAHKQPRHTHTHTYAHTHTHTSTHARTHTDTHTHTHTHTHTQHDEQKCEVPKQPNRYCTPQSSSASTVCAVHCGRCSFADRGCPGWRAYEFSSPS